MGKFVRLGSAQRARFYRASYIFYARVRLHRRVINDSLYLSEGVQISYVHKVTTRLTSFTWFVEKLEARRFSNLLKWIQKICICMHAT